MAPIASQNDIPSRSRRLASPYLKWTLSAILLPLVGGYVAYRAFVPGLPDLATLTKQAAPELPVPSLPTADETPLSKTIEFVVRRNDTMERIFRQLELNVTDLAAIRELPQVKRALDMLRPGDPITLIHVDGELQGLTRPLSTTSALTVTREGDAFKAEVVNMPVDIKPSTIHGTINNSLFASARAAGLSAELIMQLANEIFGWDIDFALDIQPGDAFTITYEKQYRDNQYVGDGRILAAEFVNDGRTYRAVRYQSADGSIGNYYTPEGRSMRKQFLRAPVDFTRISSGFTLARFHPVLNRIRAHKGVDYAAATGTPIKAAGDGKVIFAGVKGGYGNVIILDHGAGITTLYGHLSRFAGFRNGARVRQSDTIGYVGSSGLATGPHLHYEYLVNNVHRDPRTVPLPQAVPIPASYMDDFRQQTGPLLAGLDRVSQGLIMAGPTQR